jgi:multicomponent Na+:H+ antiporter subunit D
LLVLAHALARADGPVTLRASIPRSSEASALMLALCSLLLGLVPWHAYLPVTGATESALPALETLMSALWPILGGVLVAVLLGRWEHPARFPKLLIAILGPPRRIGLLFGRSIEQIDGGLRQWPAASSSLVVVAILLGVALMASR